MQPLQTTLVLVLTLALAACESSEFGSGNAKSSKSDKDSGECKDSEITVKVGEKKAGSGGDCALSKAKNVESQDTDIAEVGPDGTIVGKKPGETDVIVENEDGSKTKVHVTVTDDTDTSGGDLGDDKDDAKKKVELGEDGEKSNGCTIEGDKIKWNWPKNVQDCFDDKKLWDFTRDECTTVPEATSFDCDWNGIDSAVKGINSNFTPDWDEKRLKLISCGEREGASGGGTKKTVVWQYVMLPKEAKNGKCDIGFGAGIAIGCFSETKLSLLDASSDPSDLHECMDK